MKICSQCGLSKESEEFQTRLASPDGLTAACRKCLRVYDAKRAYNPNRIAARRRNAIKRGANITAKIKDEAWKRDWQTANKPKRQAHVLVGNAVRDGLLKKPDVCERCGDVGSIHAHHENYACPLDVMWLCSICHGIRHREINAERRNHI